MEYQVIVGNIGTVYQGNNHEVARLVYLDYCELADKGYGRAAGECVTLMRGDEIVTQHLGKEES